MFLLSIAVILSTVASAFAEPTLQKRAQEGIHLVDCFGEKASESAVVVREVISLMYATLLITS